MRPRRARLMPVEMENDIRTRTDDGIFSESLCGRKKTRQRWRVFGCIYSAAYCLFAQLHAANARQNADQLPHHPADSIVSLSAKPGRVFCFIFLYSLVSEQVLDSLILPSPFLNVFLFFTPPIGIFPITSISSPP